MLLALMLCARATIYGDMTPHCRSFHVLLASLKTDYVGLPSTAFLSFLLLAGGETSASQCPSVLTEQNEVVDETVQYRVSEKAVGRNLFGGSGVFSSLPLFLSFSFLFPLPFRFAA